MVHRELLETRVRLAVRVCRETPDHLELLVWRVHEAQLVVQDQWDQLETQVQEGARDQWAASACKDWLAALERMEYRVSLHHRIHTTIELLS